jgi:hypothetical protein
VNVTEPPFRCSFERKSVSQNGEQENEGEWQTSESIEAKANQPTTKECGMLVKVEWSRTKEESHNRRTRTYRDCSAVKRQSVGLFVI